MIKMCWSKPSQMRNNSPKNGYCKQWSRRKQVDTHVSVCLSRIDCSKSFAGVFVMSARIRSFNYSSATRLDLFATGHGQSLPVSLVFVYACLHHQVLFANNAHLVVFLSFRNHHLRQIVVTSRMDNFNPSSL